LFLFPRHAPQLLMGPRAHGAMRAALARVDEVLKQYEYKPTLKFDKGTPQSVQDMLRGVEQERLARRATAAAAAAPPPPRHNGAGGEL
jgi:hypothetical protein